MLLQCMYNNQKRTETSFRKRFLKRNLADVGIWLMNALADKVHKQEVPCTQWHAHLLQHLLDGF